MTDVSRNELLYDRELLRHYKNEHGGAIHIKRALDTNAFVYEIRTALRYWFGGRNDHRCNDVVWHRCEMIEEGLMWLNENDEFEYHHNMEVRRA